MDAPPQVPLGKQLRNLAGVSLEGQMKQISLPSLDPERLLIVTFSPGCPACRENLRGWLALAAQLKSRPGWRVVWISGDPVGFTADHLAQEHTSSVEILADPPYRTYLELGMAAVPNTIVVRPGGIVECVWQGRLGAAEWKRIAEYFKVSGLVSSPGEGASPASSGHD